MAIPFSVPDRPIVCRLSALWWLWERNNITLTQVIQHFSDAEFQTAVQLIAHNHEILERAVRNIPVANAQALLPPPPAAENTTEASSNDKATSSTTSTAHAQTLNVGSRLQGIADTFGESTGQQTVASGTTPSNQVVESEVEALIHSPTESLWLTLALLLGLSLFARLR